MFLVGMTTLTSTSLLIPYTARLQPQLLLWLRTVQVGQQEERWVRRRGGAGGEVGQEERWSRRRGGAGGNVEQEER